MSDASGNPPQRRGNFASRKARGEQGGTVGSGNSKEKAHAFDARRYHQNANTHGIHALRTFDCPVCDSKNTIRVDLNTRLREGTVRCTYCMSLRPVPDDLPYPYSTSYVPSLENKADVFFKFNEMYNALLRKQGEGDAVAGPSTSADNADAADGDRKRPREDSDVHESGRRRKGEEEEDGGLLGGLGPYTADVGMDELDGVVPGIVEGVTLEEDGVDDHGLYGGGEGETTLGEAAVLVNAAVESTGLASAPADLHDDRDGEGVNDVDLEEFFADSD